TNCVISDSTIRSDPLLVHPTGGGVRNDGVLTMIDSTVRNNTINAAFQEGAGMTNLGTLTMLGSTISGNVNKKGYYSGLVNKGTALLQDCTIAQNEGSGGAVANTSTLQMDHCTVSRNFENISQNNVAIHNGATLRLTNSIVTGSLLRGHYEVPLEGPLA